MKIAAAALLVSMSLVAGATRAPAATLDYGGLSFSSQGSSFSLTNPIDGERINFSTTAYSAGFQRTSTFNGGIFFPLDSYLSSGPLDLNPSTGPSVTAPIVLTFDRPLSEISLAIGILQSGTYTNSVQLFDGATPLTLFSQTATSGVDAPPLFSFDLGTASRLRITSAIIGVSNPSFPFPTAAAIGQITYTVSAVPLPASLPLFGAAVLAMGAVGYGMRRRRAVGPDITAQTSG